MCDAIAEKHEDWQGFPVPVPDLNVRLHDRHPARGFFAELNGQMNGIEIDIMVGGPDFEDEDCLEEQIINKWYCRKHNTDVRVWKRTHTNGKPPDFFATETPRSPDSSMQRLKLWVMTIGASAAWDMAAEAKAREKLRGMLSEAQWRSYDLTGAFLERSPRSDLTYVFRRLRPTVVLSPRWRYGQQIDSMRVLAALCLHPVGYYEDTWAGCMVPSDDVIAHLLMMRGDEAYYWSKANQHESWQPEAGL